MAKLHFVQYDKQKLYSLVESLNAGGLLAELYKRNERIISSNNIKERIVDPDEYIVNIALNQMRRIEQIDLEDEQDYINANFSIRQKQTY